MQKSFPQKCLETHNYHHQFHKMWTDDILGSFTHASIVYLLLSTMHNKKRPVLGLPNFSVLLMLMHIQYTLMRVSPFFNNQCCLNITSTLAVLQLHRTKKWNDIQCAMSTCFINQLVQWKWNKELESRKQKALAFRVKVTCFQVLQRRTKLINKQWMNLVNFWQQSEPLKELWLASEAPRTQVNRD